MPEPLSLIVLLLTTVSDRVELCTPPPFPLIVLLVIDTVTGQEPAQFSRRVAVDRTAWIARNGTIDYLNARRAVSAKCARPLVVVNSLAIVIVRQSAVGDY